ncbi:hypothetical protein EBZ39_16145, partial [bacterium]|nr:hypothetical protein [bacterium]
AAIAAGWDIEGTGFGHWYQVYAQKNFFDLASLGQKNFTSLRSVTMCCFATLYFLYNVLLRNTLFSVRFAHRKCVTS